MLTKQQIFNKVYKWFVIDKNPQSIKRYVGMMPKCLYRGENGEKCAVGVIMPDKMYKKEMEQQPFSRLYDCCPDIRTLVKKEDIPFVTTLQNIHDIYDGDIFTSYMKKELEKIAKKEGLKIPKSLS